MEPALVVCHLPVVEAHVVDQEVEAGKVLAPGTLVGGQVHGEGGKLWAERCGWTDLFQRLSF